MADPLEDAKKLVERIGINIRSNPDISDADKKHLSELIDLTIEKINEGKDGQAD
ncbi:MAG: hypothetical protein ACWGQW_03885 [bacterium]